MNALAHQYDAGMMARVTATPVALPLLPHFIL